MKSWTRKALITALVLAAAGCGSPDTTDAGPDATHDGATDAAPHDGGADAHDASDSGADATEMTDASDAGTDASETTDASDAGMDASDASTGTDASDGGADAHDASDAGADARDASAGSDASDGAVGADAATDAHDASPPSDASSTGEICNGVDDNGNGTVDEGCPTGVTFTAGATTPVYGNTTGGTAFSDPCPAGKVLVGVGGYLGGNIDMIHGICAAVTVLEDRTATPFAYSTHTSNFTTLSDHGGNITGAFTAQCPADTVAVGLSGNAGSGGTSVVTLTCAPLLITGAPGSFAFARGATTAVSGTGTNAYPAFAYTATEPNVLGALNGRAGAWVDGVGTTDAVPALTVR